MTKEKIHIGNLIRNKMIDEGRSVSWLAQKIHCKRDNIYKIFQRESIDTAQLLRISNVMKTNFFTYLSDAYQTEAKRAE